MQPCSKAKAKKLLKTMQRNIRELFRGKTPRSIYSIPFPADLRLLVLGPHPDDFDAIGVTLHFFKENGNPIEVGVVRTGSGVEDAYCSHATVDEKITIREKEQQRSCRFFGLPDACLTFLDLEQHHRANPQVAGESRDLLAAFILSRQPDFVFLPHGNDKNSSHQKMYALFKQIVFQCGYPVVSFLNRDPKTIAMRVDLYAEFDRDQAEWKAELLRFHDSQQQRNLHRRGHGFDERILNVNRRSANELSLAAEYAEAFELEFHNELMTG
jgi:LmbE family N-acetylglucosaminyl deacetylase